MFINVYKNQVLQWKIKNIIILKDAKNNNLNRNNLKNLGGKLKVPCLRIENGKNDIQWLYESKEIINYLETEFKLTTN